eukprot:GHRQ01022825.1.p1 GENE.GHRQ01022825.1~~GHRQ01022825.1.p1  ORF type:complete len:128 (+),score=12.41 GHRQ01022825.1:261-644(+)
MHHIHYVVSALQRQRNEHAVNATRCTTCAHLHGVHCNVDAAIQQRLVNLLCEQALATNVGQRLVQHLVACGLDDHNLQRALLSQLSKVALHVHVGLSFAAGNTPTDQVGTALAAAAQLMRVLALKPS